MVDLPSTGGSLPHSTEPQRLLNGPSHTLTEESAKSKSQMTSVFFDASFDDATRRKHLYQGNLFAFSPRPSTRALIEFARELIEEAFFPRNPQTAQFEIPVEEFAVVLSTLKPRFIHHPQSKRLLSGILTEFGCDLSKTYFDVPKMRSMAHGDYLKAGIA